MIIINGVECKNAETQQNIVDTYLGENNTSTLFTDDENIKKYVDSKYGPGICIFNASLVAMWLRVEQNSIVLLTRINNICSEVYNDLNNNYPIICIECAYELDLNDPIKKDSSFNPIGIIGGD